MKTTPSLVRKSKSIDAPRSAVELACHLCGFTTSIASSLDIHLEVAHPKKQVSRVKVTKAVLARCRSTKSRKMPAASGKSANAGSSKAKRASKKAGLSGKTNGIFASPIHLQESSTQMAALSANFSLSCAAATPANASMQCPEIEATEVSVHNVPPAWRDIPDLLYQMAAIDHFEYGLPRKQAAIKHNVDVDVLKTHIEAVRKRLEEAGYLVRYCPHVRFYQMLQRLPQEIENVASSFFTQPTNQGLNGLPAVATAGIAAGRSELEQTAAESLCFLSGSSQVVKQEPDDAVLPTHQLDTAASSSPIDFVWSDYFTNNLDQMNNGSYPTAANDNLFPNGFGLSTFGVVRKVKNQNQYMGFNSDMLRHIKAMQEKRVPIPPLWRTMATPKYREACSLVFEKQMSFTDAASVTNIKRVSLRWHVRRVMEKLSQLGFTSWQPPAAAVGPCGNACAVPVYKQKKLGPKIDDTIEEVMMIAQSNGTESPDLPDELKALSGSVGAPLESSQVKQETIEDYPVVEIEETGNNTNMKTDHHLEKARAALSAPLSPKRAEIFTKLGTKASLAAGYPPPLWRTNVPQPYTSAVRAVFERGISVGAAGQIWAISPAVVQRHCLRIKNNLIRAGFNDWDGYRCMALPKSSVSGQSAKKMRGHVNDLDAAAEEYDLPTRFSVADRCENAELLAKIGGFIRSCPDCTLPSKRRQTERRLLLTEAVCAVSEGKTIVAEAARAFAIDHSIIRSHVLAAVHRYPELADQVLEKDLFDKVARTTSQPRQANHCHKKPAKGRVRQISSSKPQASLLDKHYDFLDKLPPEPKTQLVQFITCLEQGRLFVDEDFINALGAELLEELNLT